MVDDCQTDDPPEWWKSALTAAWFETRMEADRTMVALSAGGIALLVTLLTAVGAEGMGAATFYTIALLGFIAAIIFGLAIFKVNAAHIAEAARDPDQADSSMLRPRLRKLDRALMVSFGLGTLFSILVGVTAAAARSDPPELTHSPAPAEAPHGGPETSRSGQTSQPDARKAQSSASIRRRRGYTATSEMPQKTRVLGRRLRGGEVRRPRFITVAFGYLANHPNDVL